jgi:colicin import membrane protein
MRANSPSAILASLSLHGFVAALIFLSLVYVAQNEKRPPVIFELVAGTPTGSPELEAPALGVPNPVKVTVPKVELPPDKPEPVVEESVPTQPVRETVPVKPVPKETVKPTPKEAVKPKPVVTKPEPTKKVTYQEFQKSNPTTKQTAQTKPKAVKVPKIDTKGIVGGMAGGSTANTRGGEGGKAMTREEHDQLSTYISMLIQELKRAHQPPSGVSDQLETRVTFDITASGAILNPRISKSSGNREFDESVLDAFRRMRSIGPTPNRRPDTWTVNFKMRDEA